MSAPGRRIARVSRTRVAVIARDRRVRAPGRRITAVRRAGVVVVASDRREDASPLREVAGVGRAGIVIVASLHGIRARAAGASAHVVTRVRCVT